jgi:dienelactone hydrolase
MAGQVRCPNCQATLRLPDPTPAAVRCSGCKNTFRIAAPQAQPPAAQPPAAAPDPLDAGLSNPFATPGAVRKSATRGVASRTAAKNQGLIWGLVALGGVLLIGLAAAGWFAMSGARNQKPAVEFKLPGGQQTASGDLAKDWAAQAAPSFANNADSKAPLPQFPDLPKPRPGYKGSDFYFIDTEAVRVASPVSIRMHVYLPKGNHPPKSLACVLIGPAGTNLLTGADVGTDPFPSETMPYVNAGMAVVFYSLPGDIEEADEVSEERLISAIQRAYPIFRSSNGGVDNSKYALDFVLNKLPQVDPQKIFAAGHSSAGTLALMFAANDPRLAGCIAYAPCTDPVLRNRELLADPISNRLLPGCAKFLEGYSPIRQIGRYQMPLFVFHARDDSNTPISDSQNFVNQLRSDGKTVEFKVVDTGDHYQSMIDEGIPAGIQWIKARLQK